ncbi:MAG TPA: hypothetical protein VJQ47_11575 [Steroidobacteraceae bacterium]|nr:hypothetical protein [Steroidobacteraceae bacterium]
MAKAYKVIVFGPGGLGSVAIWEILQSKAFKLVGVRAYSESKHGKDVGTLFGLPDMGVKMTTDVAKLLKKDCDVVLHTGRDLGTFNTDEEICQILAAGHNVVTPLPYQNAHLFRDRKFLSKLTAACKKGKSVFHASGIDPDVISERVVPALTSMCTDIESVKLQENWDSTLTPAETLAIVGFGKPPAEAAKSPAAAMISTNFLHAIARSMEEVLGVKYSKVEETHDFIAAKKEVRSIYITIPAGGTGRVTHRVKGFVEGKGPGPFFTIEYNWVIGDEMLPDGVAPGEKWIATVEGRPSMRMVVNLRASHKNEDRSYQIGNLATEPGYHGTIAPCLLAIPLVCKAKPGLLPSFGPGLHWMKDPRDSLKLHK